MLRHDLRRALLSPRTLFVALVYGVLLSLGATETWNDSCLLYTSPSPRD